MLKAKMDDFTCISLNKYRTYNPKKGSFSYDCQNFMYTWNVGVMEGIYLATLHYSNTPKSLEFINYNIQTTFLLVMINLSG